MTATAVALAALEAFRAQDRTAIEQLLDPAFRFTSPQDDHLDREAYLDRCFPTADRFTTHRTLAVVPVDPAAVLVLYEYVLADGGRYRNVEHLRVRDGRLVEVQVFFGGRLG